MPRSRRTLPRPLLVVWAASLVGALVVVGVSMWARERSALMLLDTVVAAREYERVWLGVASTLGLMGWAAAAASLVLAGLVVRSSRRDPALAGLLVEGGVLVAVLAVDDAVLLHEHWLALRAGIPDVVTYVVYGVAGAVIGVRHRSALAAVDPVPFLAAGAALALSVAVDIVLDAGLSVRASSAFEDLPKLWGIALFALAAVRTSYDAITGRGRDGAGPSPRS